MGEIKRLKRGNKELLHTRVVDWMGFERDCVEIIKEENGHKTHYPFMPPIKVTDYDRNSPIKTTTDYSDAEYEQMLSEEPTP